MENARAWRQLELEAEAKKSNSESSGGDFMGSTTMDMAEETDEEDKSTSSLEDWEVDELLSPIKDSEEYSPRGDKQSDETGTGKGKGKVIPRIVKVPWKVRQKGRSSKWYDEWYGVWRTPEGEIAEL